ncbi:hypothetical protein RSAG8_00511, partial [Rhizoctonia solani AG-8 WAC10335]
MASLDIPSIDFSKRPDSKDVSAAMANLGFLFIKNADVPSQNLVRDMFALSKEFFEGESLEEKQKVPVTVQNRGWIGSRQEALDTGGHPKGDLKEAFNLSKFTADGQPMQPLPPTLSKHAGSEEEEAKSTAAKSALNIHSKTAQKILAAQKQPAAQTLFMGNLPFETKEEDIRQMIEGHGLPSDLETQAKKDEAAKNLGGKPQRWLKKIRMGTFEDSGLCKGWAFLDFLNTAYATAVLVTPRNHHLNGRKLVLEYGSPDAVRRGGGGPRPNKRHIEKEEEHKETPRAAKKRKFAEANAENDDASEQATESPKKPKPKGDEQYVRAKDGRLRPKPGAALAMAKKEAVAIVPSTGKRTVF